MDNRMAQFESSVNSDGSQTKQLVKDCNTRFESSVNSDGSQTTSVKY